MALFVDSAVIDEVAQIAAILPIAGVTTNPALLLAARERGQRLDDLRTLAALLEQCSGTIFIQPPGATGEALARMASKYLDRDPNRVVPKLPMSEAGLRAARLLRQGSGRFAFTACVTPAQAYCGMIAGADWVIPYFGRLRRAALDPSERVRAMTQVLARSERSARVLVASLHTPADVTEALLAGAHDVTVAPATIQQLWRDPLTDAALASFAEDWGRLAAP